MSIHPTAIIDPSARLGDDVSIGAFAVVGPGTVLGKGCKLHHHSIIEFTELGDSSEVYPFASIGLAPQHLGYKGEATRVVVGQKTIFREGVTVHRGTIQDGGVTVIGNDCFLMAYSHVAHDCHIGNQVIMANGALLAGHITVGDRTFISALAAVHQHVRLGNGAMIGGGSMVSQDVPPYALVQGDRATLRGLNVVGLRRSKVDKESLRLIKDAYRIIFYSGLMVEEALKDPLFKNSNSFVSEIKKFMSTPKRGFIRPLQRLNGEEEDEVS